MIQNDPVGYFSVIAAMLATVYLSRIGGFWLLGRVTIGHRLRRILESLPGAVIAATVAPVLVHGGVSAVLALAAASLAMLVVRNDFAAVIASVAVAAAARAAGI